MGTMINLLPFLVEAFGTNQNIRADVDRLYSCYKDVFYQYAKESKYCDHPIIKDGDIYKEEYARKSLGILEYIQDTEDTEVTDTLINVMKKGWPRVYAYLNVTDKVDFEKYASAYLDLDKITDDELNSELAVLYFFAHIFDKEVVNNHTLEVLESTLILRERFYFNDSSRFTWNTLSPDIKQKAKSLKQRIYDTKYPIKGYMDIYMPEDEETRDIFTVYTYLFDTEFLSTTILQSVNYTDKDINEILASYFSIYKNQNVNEAIKFLVPGIIIKGLIKAYKEVKEYYFQNNKETMYLEMKNQADKIAQLESQNKFLSLQNDTLKNRLEEAYDKAEMAYKDEIRSLQKQVNELQQQLEKAKQNDRELFALREFIFNISQEEETEESAEQTIATDMHGIVIGGRERWQKRLQDRYPNFIFISADTKNFDTAIFDNADIVLFNTAYLSHSVYDKAMNEIRKRNLPIKYITNNFV
jgi:polyhydroxyalkanoate synthesis regulator phasin